MSPRKTRKTRKTRKAKTGGRAVRITLITSLLVLSGLLAGLSWADRANRETLRELERLDGRVRDLRELVTARKTYRDILYKKVTWQIIREKELLMAFRFRVEAGLDLSDGFRVVDRGRDGLVIGLPPARVLRVDALEESYEQIVIRTFLSTLRLSDFQDDILVRRERIRQEAEQSDLLVRARSNAERILRELFLKAGFPEVRFVTLPPEVGHGG